MGSESEIRHEGKRLWSLRKKYGVELKPLSIIYWSRVGFGVVAALFCVFLPGINSLLNGMTVAILIYLVTYYVLKGMFMLKVEKPSKIVTMGIGAYFLTWIVAWAILYTLLFY